MSLNAMLLFFSNCIVSFAIGIWLCKCEYISRNMSAVIAICLPFILFITQGFAAHFFNAVWCPPFPACINGCCKWYDYELEKTSEASNTYSCRCGEKYYYDKKRSRFLLISLDGSLRPFRVLKNSWFGWTLDNDD